MITHNHFYILYTLDIFLGEGRGTTLCNPERSEKQLEIKIYNGNKVEDKIVGGLVEGLLIQVLSANSPPFSPM